VDDELEPEERAMIRSIFELADTLVREIMVPRPDMVTVPEDAPLHEVVRIAIEQGYSRIPVRDPDDEDTIVGVVYAKDLLRRLATEQHRTRWGDLVRTPTFVPETKRCDDLLRDLQAAAVHLAIVVDEYGEIVGLVTIEDILEEIVGEIVDEHDREEPLVEVLGDGELRIDGRLGVDDLNELLGAELPEEGWDTVGGLVFGTLGRVPAVGESVELEGSRSPSSTSRAGGSARSTSPPATPRRPRCPRRPTARAAGRADLGGKGEVRRDHRPAGP
jgi:CBS domain containing-hemolysin-like protein